MTAQAYTVIIPTLNAAGTLGRQLEVVLGQGLAPVEVIVVDSQSTDGTAELAASVPGVRVIPVKAGGIRSRRNPGHGDSRQRDALRDTAHPGCPSGERGLGAGAARAL